MPEHDLPISEETRRALFYLARETGKLPSEIVERAVEAYRRQWIMDRANESYAKLRNDPDLWQEVLEERAEWDATLSDSSRGCP